MFKTVYLAGPIMGRTGPEANDWRKDVDSQLQQGSDGQIRGVSPLRCEPLHGERYSHHSVDLKFGTPQAIGSKNIFDVRATDMTLAYLPKPSHARAAGHQSYGTISEVALAFAWRKPCIIVSDDPDIFNHPVQIALCGWMLPELDDAVEVIFGILGGYYRGGKNV